jgi:hypothetical protein
MNAIAKAEDKPTAQIVSLDAGTLMGALTRAASDPSTDVDKFERLMKMYFDIENRNAEQAYNVSMTAAQSEIGVVGTNKKNSQTNSKYATYDALDRAVRQIYVKHGFSLSFDTGEGAPADHARVLCRVGHIGGHSRTHHVDMPADGKGAKGGDVMTKTHAAGSAFSYGQRYLLKLIFNIATGEDDDGNAASVRDRSAGFTAAMAALNACKTLDDIKAWKARNSEVIGGLPQAEADELVRTANQRSAKMREQAQ